MVLYIGSRPAITLMTSKILQDTFFEKSLDIAGDHSKPFLCLDPNIVRNEALFDDVT